MRRFACWTNGFEADREGRHSASRRYCDVFRQSCQRRPSACRRRRVKNGSKFAALQRTGGRSIDREPAQQPGGGPGRRRRAIRRTGAHLLFLPPYSPDLNPIEQLFAKLKHLMRAAQQRTVESTWRKAGALLDLVSPAECANYLVNSGYDSV